MRPPLVPFVLTAVASLLQVAASSAADADEGSVGILVLMEHRVGSPALAQPYVDRFVTMAAQENGWSAAKGQYLTSRSSAEAFIQAQPPHYGILSLAAFLALRRVDHLDVLGQVTSALAGGRQYHLISSTAASLGECKGKRLASDHTDDAKFIERVVAAGRFKLSDFKLVQTQRPLQTIQKVVTGEADCALVDEAQLSELSHIEGVDGVRSVWKSAELPQMAVVAFPAAPKAERRKFQENLADVCDGNGQTVCAEVGITALKAASDADYAAVVAAYGE